MRDALRAVLLVLSVIMSIIAVNGLVAGKRTVFDMIAGVVGVTCVLLVIFIPPSKPESFPKKDPDW